jgi:membrane protein involved in colicin uptake
MCENLKTLRGSADASLFPDAETLATKDPEDVLAIMQGRIAQAKAEAERRAEEARERIRREEQAKTQAKAEAERRAEEDAAKVAEPPRGGAIQPQVAAEPDAAAWRAELVDIKALCRAIADGKAPADLVQFSQAAGNRLATALNGPGVNTADVPGVRFVRDKSMAVRV